MLICFEWIQNRQQSLLQLALIAFVSHNCYFDRLLNVSVNPTPAVLFDHKHTCVCVFNSFIVSQMFVVLMFFCYSLTYFTFQALIIFTIMIFFKVQLTAILIKNPVQPAGLETRSFMW